MKHSYNMAYEMKPGYYFALSAVLLIFVFLAIDSYYSVSGLLTGSINIGVRETKNYYNPNFTIYDQKILETAFNITLVFGSNETVSGMINITGEKSNPSNCSGLTNDAKRFCIAKSNITFTNVSVYFKYNESDIVGTDESSLRVYSCNETGEWKLLESYVNTTSNEVFGILQGFPEEGAFLGVFGFVPTTTTVFSPPSGGGSPSGPGGYPSSNISIASEKGEFSAGLDVFSTSIFIGENSTKEFYITSIYSKEMTVNISLRNLSGIAYLNQTSLRLLPGETKQFSLLLSASKVTKPGSYVGSILMDSGDVQRRINIAVLVKERYPLFDINLSILNESKSVEQGSEVFAEIYMENKVAGQNMIDVELNLFVVDFEGEEVISSEEETLAVEKNLSLTRSLKLTEGIPEGKYLFKARIKYPKNQYAEAFEIFEVAKKETVLSPWITIVISTILIAILLIFFGFFRR